MSNVLNLKIGEIAKVYAGGTPSRKHPEYWGGAIPWVKTTHIQNCIIERDDIDEAITDIGLKFSSARMVSEGTILMAMIGQGKTRGQVAILNVEAAINQNCVAIVLNEDIDRDYLWHQLRFRYHAIRNISNSSGQQNLNGEIIKGITLPFPSYEKQHCIGKILNQWDAAIEKTEALIEAKERQFRWLQNHLMDIKFRSYSKRLCEFSGIVQHKKIKEVGELKPLTVKLHCKGIEANERDMQITLSDKGRPYYQRFTGDFLIGRQNFHNGGFGIVPERLNGYIASNAISTLDIDKAKLDPDYLFYFFSRKDYYLRIGNIMDGTGQKEISDKQIMKLPVSIPSLERQQEVVMTLDAARQEIGLLKKLAEQYRTQKRGLMQKLLPGKWDVANG